MSKCKITRTTEQFFTVFISTVYDNLISPPPVSSPLFECLTRVSPRNHMLDGDLDRHTKGYP